MGRGLFLVRFSFCQSEPPLNCTLALASLSLATCRSTSFTAGHTRDGGHASLYTGSLSFGSDHDVLAIVHLNHRTPVAEPREFSGAFVHPIDAINLDDFATRSDLWFRFIGDGTGSGMS